MGGASGEWVFLVAYISFLLIAGVIVGLDGADRILGEGIGDVTVTPPNVSAPSGFDPITTLIYVVTNIGFLFSLAFLTPFSGYGLLGWFAVMGGLVSLYITFRLIRGGG